MRVCTWNLGLFSWMKYAGFFGFRINAQKIKHEYYSRGNRDKITAVLKKTRADILVLQEFYTAEDAVDLKDALGFKHYTLIDTWYRKHAVAIFSNFEIVEVDRLSEFSVYKVAGRNFIPIHLNSFSPTKRSEQVDLILELVRKHKGVHVLGDTNFWNSSGYFMSRVDKKSYGKLVRLLHDTTEDINTSYFGIAMDKIFVPLSMGDTKSESPKLRGKYMDHFPVIVEL